MITDKQIETLLQVEGKNPRPTDFDSYWNESLAELDTVLPNVELIPAAFQTPYATCSHLYFTGTGGARVHAKLLRPKTITTPTPVLLKFHGYSGNSGDWSRNLALVAAGFTVAFMDARGQSGLSEDVGGVKGTTIFGHIVRGLALENDPKHLLFRHIFLDTVQLGRAVLSLPDVDADNLNVTGASQGGGLALACAALEPRVKRAFVAFPFLCDYQGVCMMGRDQEAYNELREYFRKYDPHHENEANIFERLGYIDVQHLAPRIRAEVVMAVGLKDDVCPPATQFAAYNRITSDKSLLVYPDFAHEDLPGYEDKLFSFLT